MTLGSPPRGPNLRIGPVPEPTASQEPMKATSVQDAFERICAMEAPLHERMAAFSEAVREFGLPYAEAYDDLVARIRSGEAGRAAPAPGEPIPEFLLPDSSGRLVSLDDLIGEGPAVISFNRGHWCEYRNGYRRYRRRAESAARVREVTPRRVRTSRRRASAVPVHSPPPSAVAPRRRKGRSCA